MNYIHEKNFRHLLINFALIFLSLMSLYTHVVADDRRTDTDKLKIMTLNTIFMWDGIQPEEGNVDFGRKGIEYKARMHMDKIAEIIRKENPDIVNLVEIENEKALSILNNDFLGGQKYEVFFAQGRDTDTGQDLGLLSRIDPINNEIFHDTRTGTSENYSKSVSKNYIARFDINGLKIGIVGLHFLSRPTNYNRKPARQAQAEAVKSMVIQLKKEGFEQIVLGDFNDYDDECRDSLNHKPVTSVLNIIKKMEKDDYFDDLYNVACDLLPKSERYTHFWDKNHDHQINFQEEVSSIDHILVSPTLKEYIENVSISHSSNPKKNTDRYPVIVEFMLYANSKPMVPIPPPKGFIFKPKPTPKPNDSSKNTSE